MNKVSYFFILGILFGSLFILPNTYATQTAASECDVTRSRDILKISGVIEAGPVDAWSNIPGCGIARSPTQVFNWVGVSKAPAYLGLTPSAVVQTWTGENTSGCTFGTVTMSTGTPSSAAITSAATATLTMTANECRVVIHYHLEITSASVSVFDWHDRFGINIIVPSQAIYNFNCAATVTTANAVDPDGSTCNTPVQNNINFDYLCNAALTTPLAFNPATGTCTVPQINNYNFLCDAPGTTPSVFNPATTTCNDVVFSGTFTMSGTINVVNSGGQNIAITSWPALTATVGFSGPLSIQNTAGQTFAVTAGVTGSLTVTNAGGQTIAISSWPILNAVLSGTVTIPNQCTAPGTCYFTLDGDLVIDANLDGEIDTVITGALDIHQDEACGASIACHIECDAGTCMSDVSIGNNTNNITQSNNLNIAFLPPFLLLVAIAFFVVMGESRRDALYWFFATILSIYLLIERNDDSVIPIPIYVGWIFITLYQAISLLMNAKAERLDGNREE